MKTQFSSILFLFLIFCAWLHIELNKKHPENEFWTKERKANATQIKTLDGLNYITIPLDQLPFDALKNHPEVEHMEYTIQNLSKEGRKIVNLTGITNTDLKLQYGAPNLSRLMEYDRNYILLVTTLQDWGKVLYEEGLYEDAARLLEFAVSTRTDVSETYRLLCDMYKCRLGLSKEESDEKISALLTIAESLNSLTRSKIETLLKEQLKNTQADSIA